MAKKGIRYAVFGKYNETTSGGSTTIEYTEGKYLSPVAGFTGTPNNSNVKDYGDDKCVEVANETTGASLSVELTNDDLDIFTFLLGHTVDAVGEHVIYDVDDVAPYVGVGAIGKSGSKWRAKFYTKVLFAEPTDENTTKQESTTFGHITLEGDAVPDANGTWKIEKEFSSESAAKDWLNTQAGVGAGGATGAST